MSVELGHLPLSNFGKYEWQDKIMSHSCWGLRISERLRELKTPNIKSVWPVSISCKVDIKDGKYWWRVTASDWEFRLSKTEGWVDTAEEAICKAEEVGELYWDQLVEGWMLHALSKGWRPPSTSGTVMGMSPKSFNLVTVNETRP